MQHLRSFVALHMCIMTYISTTWKAPVAVPAGCTMREYSMSCYCAIMGRINMSAVPMPPRVLSSFPTHALPTLSSVNSKTGVMPSKTKITKKLFTVTFPAVQWLRPHASVAGGTGLIPGQELRSCKPQDMTPPPPKKKAYTKWWLTE